MSDNAAPVGPPDGGAPHLDIGHGHTVTFVSAHDEPDGQWCGAIVAHPKPDGTACIGGYISFEGRAADTPSARQAGALWRVESWEPLTLSPSLLCRICQDHGWVRNGTWVPA